MKKVYILFLIFISLNIIGCSKQPDVIGKFAFRCPHCDTIEEVGLRKGSDIRATAYLICDECYQSYLMKGNIVGQVFDTIEEATIEAAKTPRKDFLAVMEAYH